MGEPAKELQRPLQGDGTYAGKRRPLVRSRYELSQRELQVLLALADGKRNKEIAAQLGISLPTVNKHVTSILVKMKASSRTDAVSRALRQGLVA